SRRHGRPHDVRQAVQFPSETLEPTALPDNGKKGNASCTAGTSGNPCKTSEIASFPALIETCHPFHAPSTRARVAPILPPWGPLCADPRWRVRCDIDGWLQSGLQS